MDSRFECRCGLYAVILLSFEARDYPKYVREFCKQPGLFFPPPSLNQDFLMPQVKLGGCEASRLRPGTWVGSVLEREEPTPLTSALLRFKKGKRGGRWMALRVLRAAPRSIASGEGELEGEWWAVTGRPSQTTGPELTRKKVSSSNYSRRDDRWKHITKGKRLDISWCCSLIPIHPFAVNQTY